VLSTLALHMQTVAVGWQLYSLTGSALDLGLVGLVQFVPTVILTSSWVRSRTATTVAP
jgi:hypothetical protein